MCDIIELHKFKICFHDKRIAVIINDIQHVLMDSSIIARNLRCEKHVNIVVLVVHLLNAQCMRSCDNDDAPIALVVVDNGIDYIFDTVDVISAIICHCIDIYSRSGFKLHNSIHVVHGFRNNL